MRSLIFFGTLSLFFYSILLSDLELPLTVQKTSDIITTPLLSPPKERLKSKTVTGKKASFSKTYPFQEIDKSFRSIRHQMTSCFFLNREKTFERVKMNVHWTGDGIPRTIQLYPDLGSDVSNCLMSRIQTLSFSPHPGLQPFSYEVTLIPARSTNSR